MFHLSDVPSFGCSIFRMFHLSDVSPFGCSIPLRIRKQQNRKNVQSSATRIIILYNYLIVFRDYCWATCFDLLLSHLQAVETQGYLQLNVTPVLIAWYEVSSALQL
jgi:hypothetical protein